MRIWQVDIDGYHLEYVRRCTQHASDSQIESKAMTKELVRFNLDYNDDRGGVKQKCNRCKYSVHGHNRLFSLDCRKCAVISSVLHFTHSIDCSVQLLRLQIKQINTYFYP